MCEHEESLQKAGFNASPTGFDPSRYVLHSIAAMIDHPSLYMGGPSRGAIKKAEEIWRFVTTDAIAIEAGTAETERLSPKGESAGREASPGSSVIRSAMEGE